MKRLALLLVLMIVLSSTDACTEEAQQAGTGPVAADQDMYVSYGGGTPLSIDPALNSATNGARVLQAAHAGLMGYIPNGETAEVGPELAESYTVSEDGLTYTFTLRPGLKWSDGSDFSASEVVFSWNRAASDDLGADYGFMFDVIEGYGTGHQNEPTEDIGGDDSMPSFAFSIAPLVVVVALNYIFTRWILSWDPALFAEYFPNLKIASVVGTWALIMALLIGILMIVAVGWKKLGMVNVKKCINIGAIGSLLAILNTASEVGYGNVIAQLPGFKSISSAITSIRVGNSPLLSLAVAASVLAGITGSGSGGLSIALETLSKQYIEWANQIGMPLEQLHRIAAMSCTGLDTLPHNGAVITLLAITGMTHKESYLDICVCTVIITTSCAWGAATMLSLF